MWIPMEKGSEKGILWSDLMLALLCQHSHARRKILNRCCCWKCGLAYEMVLVGVGGCLKQRVGATNNTASICVMIFFYTFFFFLMEWNGVFLNCLSVWAQTPLYRFGFGFFFFFLCSFYKNLIFSFLFFGRYLFCKSK